MNRRWNDDAEQYWQARERQRSEDREDSYGRDDLGYPRAGREDRTFEENRVFGERETGAGYNRDHRFDWQDRDYTGASPAMRRGDYESGYRPRGSSRDAYGPSDWRNEQPGPYGYAPDARRFGSVEADQRWAREMGRPFGGPTAYGDRDRPHGRSERRDFDDRFEDRAREAGDFFRRAGRRLSEWFVDAGQDDDRRRYEDYRGHRGVGPKGYKRSDERVADEVHQRLTDDAWLDASEVSCSVSAGEVTLSGTVVSREAKHRAERLVEDIAGVVHVQNNLRVATGSYFTRSGSGFGHSASEAAMASSETLKDVTDGNAGPPAQKKN